MTYNDSADLAVNPAFIKRVKVAVISAAGLVSVEPWTYKGAVPYYEKRLRLSQQALGIVPAPGVYAPPGISSEAVAVDAIVSKFVWPLVSTLGLDEAATDAEILDAVQLAWNSIAGVTPLEMPV